MYVDKHKTSVIISDEAKRLMSLLALKLGVSRSAVLELAVREMAKRKGVS